MLATSSYSLDATCGVTFKDSEAVPQNPEPAIPKAKVLQKKAGVDMRQEEDTTRAASSSKTVDPPEGLTTSPPVDVEGAVDEPAGRRITRSSKKRDTSQLPNNSKRARRCSPSPGKRRHPVEEPKRVRPKNAPPGVRQPQVQEPPPLTSRVKRGMRAIFQYAIIAIDSWGGLRSIEWDAIRAASWVIAASTGAVSQTHHDASGYLTWVRCEMGSKFWGYVVSKQKAQSMVDAMKAYKQMVDYNTEPEKLREIATVFQTCITRGTVVYVYNYGFYRLNLSLSL